MPNLFPTYHLPTIIMPSNQPVNKNFKTPLFNFELGDFEIDPAGRLILGDAKEAFETFCLKTCQTERGTKLAYSDSIGVEFEGIEKLSSSQVKSMLIRTITESIMAHPLAEYVKDFEFTSEGDKLYVSFVVKGKIFDEPSRLTVTY